MSTLDYAQVAFRLGVTEHWVRRNAQHLPHHRFGRKYVFTEDDVAEMLDARKVRPVAEQQPRRPGELRPLTRGSRRAS